ncbi:hypothetical protein GCM10011501_02200 [Thalassotalea profundi]|uniref:Solute-binding protein family 3/N-terminal domain-containing protein n=2 Tax=Thalassotalea profundi TaxID=2036687 RepID=A0ABQ3IEG4_9GAMM|nr:hypothetical protein GCM10011501_02200 [Thalassotalea profundi]
MPLSTAQEVKVYTEIFPPFQHLEQNEIAGSATEKVKDILNSTNLTSQFHIVPWVRAFQTVKQQKNTLIYSMYRSPEREPFFHWLSIVGQIKNGFVALKSKNIQLASFEDSKTYITAVVKESYPYQYLKSEGFSEDENLVIINSRETQLSLLLNNKVDFLFGDLNFMRQRLKNRGLSPLLIENAYTEPGWEIDLYLAINKNSDEQIVKQLKNAISTGDKITAL